ncbi:MAG: peptide ABC transporter substrate-binding protein, partial [Pseudomonadota bacterium]|nr:peptide ABC transporter substrate-binding protein [Pseudomonadota bacterium]
LRTAGLDRRPLTVEWRYNSGELHGRIAIAVARMWKESLGIETVLRAEEFKVLLQDIDRGDVDVFRASWVGDYNDAFGFLQIFQRGFGLNMPHYANPDYDRSLQLAEQEVDAGKRRLLLEHAEAVMLADQPIIPLYFYVSKHLVDARIQGWHENALNIVYSKAVSKARPDAGS